MYTVNIVLLLDGTTYESSKETGGSDYTDELLLYLLIYSLICYLLVSISRTGH